MAKAQKEETVEQQLRSARSEVKEFRGWLDRDRKEIEQLKKETEESQRLRSALYAGFMQERIECIARLQRLGMRIRALGFAVPSIPGDPVKQE